jgi:hypothetical protein
MFCSDITGTCFETLIYNKVLYSLSGDMLISFTSELHLIANPIYKNI